MHVNLLFLVLLLKGVSSAKILALMVVPSHSHHLWNAKYLQGLAERGHDITYFSVDKFADPPKNIRQIFVEGAYEVYGDIDFSEITSVGPYRSTLLLHQWSEVTSVAVTKSKSFQELKKVIATEKFDLVIHDFAQSWFLLAAVDLLGRPPILAISAFGIPPITLSVLGNPLYYSSYPHFLSHHSSTMNFMQRADNFFLHLWSLAIDWVFLGREDNLAKTFFGPNVRPLKQILDDINIILVNSNYAMDFPFPKVPGLIPIGGLHIEKPKPLPQELKNFLDGAKNGAVYFSLGSNIKSWMVAAKNVEILCEAFGRISPVKVLWKWDAESLPKQPSNVKIVKWVPQNDVLAHPNVRLFFTHSGLLSTQEALYHGKPIVGMPFFLDQHVNLNKCIERGLGEKLILDSLTVESVVATLKKVLTEPRYAQSAQNGSFIFKDAFEHPLDRAIFWTEYTIRHKGAHHLRYSSRNLSWYQNWMLDVVALTVCLGSFVSWCIHKLVVMASVAKKADVKKKE